MNKRSWAVAFDGATSFLKSVMAVPKENDVTLVRRRPVARALNFDLSNEEMQGISFTFVTDTVQKRKPRRRKPKGPIPVVQPENKRFTRSSLKLDGYKAQPIAMEFHTQNKKRPRAKLLLV
jgi:hypothetical protein